MTRVTATTVRIPMRGAVKSITTATEKGTKTVMKTMKTMMMTAKKTTGATG